MPLERAADDGYLHAGSEFSARIIVKIVFESCTNCQYLAVRNRAKLAGETHYLHYASHGEHVGSRVRAHVNEKIAGEQRFLNRHMPV